jgi:cytochrome P450
MARIAASHVARWPRGRPFRVLPRMRRLVDEIFVRLVLGVRDEDRAAALAASVWRMLWTPGNPPLPPPGEGDGLMGILGERLFARRKEPVERLLAAEIEARRSSRDDGLDVIGCMVRADPPLTTPEMIEEMIPLLMAGQEPPGAGLTWVLDRLGREPEMADHFASAGNNDPRKEAFVRETLRLRPAVHSVLRRLTVPMDVAGHALPAGAVAMVPVVLVHRDARAFPDPDSFRSERFLPGDGDAAPYLPFGGGARRCLGQHLAQAEIGSVVPAILQRIRLQPLWPQPERMVVRGTVAVPHRSELAIARDR